MSGQLEFGEEDRTAILGRAWELALHLLAGKVSTVAYATYIQPIQPISYVGSVITLGISNAFYRERIEKNHVNAIRSALEFHLDTTGVQIVFTVLSRDEQRSADARRAEAGKNKLKPGQTALSLDVEPTNDPATARETQYSTGRRQDRMRDDTADGPAPDAAAANSSVNTPRKTAPANGRQSTASAQSSFGGAYNNAAANSSGGNDAPAYKSSYNANNASTKTTASGTASNSSSDDSASASNVPSVTPRNNTPRSNPKSKIENRKSPEPLPIPSLPLNERYVFETFLVGRSNRLAHAGATGVAERPGEVYNPLFLYGGPGLGKTHLMQGIAHTVRKRDPRARIAYVSAEYFAQHYISSINSHATEDFRRQYRDVDLWLVDDIQFIASKDHTKEEFFHTFNTLYQSGKQIVIASDRSPRELNTMDERLRSRFQSGLIADISAPELETRIAILQQCRQREGFVVANDVLDYIASAIQSNIRALEGALTKLIAYSSIHNTSATAELAQSVLSEYFIEKPIRSRKIGVDDVINAVAPYFGVAPAAIKGPNRNKDVSLARQVAMYLSRELLPELNMKTVGEAFDNRDHATIVYACQRVRGLMEVDTELKTMIVQTQKRLSI